MSVLKKIHLASPRIFVWCAGIAVVAAIFGGIFLQTSVAPPKAAVSAPEKIRGISLIGCGPVSEGDFTPILATGAEWVNLVAYGSQDGHDHTEVRLHTSEADGVYWGETDAGLTATAAMAHRLGLKTALKPQIWLRDPAVGDWCGRIAMSGEADWELWFASYTKFILHYALLAEKAHISLLSIGTELGDTIHREREWRGLIAQVRQVFHGQLTYGANWDDEWENVRFWDALDHIGLHAYFTLSDKTSPTRADIRDGWAPIRPRLAALAARWGKPVIFLEIGYKSRSDAVRAPHAWPDIPAGTPDQRVQADAYAAFLETFWPEPWVSGAFIWCWHPNTARSRPFPETDFSPQGKLAAGTLAHWWRKPGR